MKKVICIFLSMLVVFSAVFCLFINVNNVRAKAIEIKDYSNANFESDLNAKKAKLPKDRKNGALFYLISNISEDPVPYMPYDVEELQKRFGGWDCGNDVICLGDCTIDRVCSMSYRGLTSATVITTYNKETLFNKIRDKEISKLFCGLYEDNRFMAAFSSGVHSTYYLRDKFGDIEKTEFKQKNILLGDKQIIAQYQERDCTDLIHRKPSGVDILNVGIEGFNVRNYNTNFFDTSDVENKIIDNNLLFATDYYSTIMPNEFEIDVELEGGFFDKSKLLKATEKKAEKEPLYFYVYYEEIKHPISFVYRNADGNWTTNVQLLKLNDQIVAPLNVPNPPYGKFKAWDKEFGLSVGKETITAIYEYDQFCVNFYNSSGEFLETQTTNYYSEITPPKIEDYRSADNKYIYTCNGWSFEKNNPKKKVDLKTYRATEDVSMYPIFKKRSAALNDFWKKIGDFFTNPFKKFEQLSTKDKILEVVKYVVILVIIIIAICLLAPFAPVIFASIATAVRFIVNIIIFPFKKLIEYIKNKRRYRD